MKKDFFQQMAGELKSRNNPSDLKATIIGTVTSIEPICVSVEDGAINLKQGEELELSEWFRFRCDIDKTKALSQAVISDCDNAEAVTETHSFTGTPCVMPNAISLLATAIISINTELLQLKCDLKVGDYVSVASLEQEGSYILLDKVLSV